MSAALPFLIGIAHVHYCFGGQVRHGCPDEGEHDIAIVGCWPIRLERTDESRSCGTEYCCLDASAPRLTISSMGVKLIRVLRSAMATPIHSVAVRVRLGAMALRHVLSEEPRYIE